MLMNKLYKTFLKIVSEQRGLGIEEVEDVAQGRVWSGSQAREIRLVDSQGGLLEALAEAKRLADIPPSEKVGIRIYPRKKSLLDMIGQLIGLNAAATHPAVNIQTTILRYEKFFPALMLPYKIRFY